MDGRSKANLCIQKNELILSNWVSLGTGTGVTNDNQTKWASWIMMGTLLPFLVAQIPRLFGLKTEGHFFIAIAAVIALLGLVAYCTYQVG